MEKIREQLKNELEIILGLLEWNQRSGMKNKEVGDVLERYNGIYEMLFGSGKPLKEEFIKDIKDTLYEMRCVRLETQLSLYIKYFIEPCTLHMFSEANETFVSSAESDVMEDVKRFPTVRLDVFYNMLLVVDEVYVNETLALIKSSNPAILADEILTAIEEQDYDMFKECISKYGADISNAGRYLNMVHCIKVMSSPEKRHGLIECAYESDSMYTVVNKISRVSQYNTYSSRADENYNDCHELEIDVSSLFSFFEGMFNLKSQCALFPEDKRELLQLCYNSVEFKNLSDDELEELCRSIMIDVQKEINKPLSIPQTSFKSPSCKIDILPNVITIEKQESYPNCLAHRDRLTKKETIDIIVERFLQKKIKNANAENIKYVFFGEGTKPEKTLNWVGTKKDLVCFIYYISGDYNIVDDEVWVPYLNDNILWKGEDNMFGRRNDSSSARRDDKIKFNEKMRGLFNESEMEKYKSDI